MSCFFNKYNKIFGVFLSVVIFTSVFLFVPFNSFAAHSETVEVAALPYVLNSVNSLSADEIDNLNNAISSLFPDGMPSDYFWGARFDSGNYYITFQFFDIKPVDYSFLIVHPTSYPLPNPLSFNIGRVDQPFSEGTFFVDSLYVSIVVNAFDYSVISWDRGPGGVHMFGIDGCYPNYAVGSFMIRPDDYDGGYIPLFAPGSASSGNSNNPSYSDWLDDFGNGTMDLSPDDSTPADSGSWLKNIFNRIGQFNNNVVSSFGGLIGFLSDKFDGIRDSFSDIKDFLSDKLTGIFNKLSELPSKIYDSFSGILNSIKGAVDNVVSAFLDSDFARNLLSFVDTIKDKIGGIFGFVENIKEFVANIKDFVGDIKDILSALVEFFLPGEDGLGFKENLILTLKEFMGLEPEQTFLDFWKHLFTMLFDPTEYKDQIMDYAEEHLFPDSSNFTFVFYSYKNLFEDIVTNVIHPVETAPVIHFPDFRIGGVLIEDAELDLNFLNPYIGYIHGVITVFLYLTFIVGVYKNLPRLIEGFSPSPVVIDTSTPDINTSYGYKNGVKTK